MKIFLCAGTKGVKTAHNYLAIIVCKVINHLLIGKVLKWKKMFVYKAARDVNDWAKYRTHQPLQRPAFFFVNVRARAF